MTEIELHQGPKAPHARSATDWWYGTLEIFIKDWTQWTNHGSLVHEPLVHCKIVFFRLRCITMLACRIAGWSCNVHKICNSMVFISYIHRTHAATISPVNLSGYLLTFVNWLIFCALVSHSLALVQELKELKELRPPWRLRIQDLLLQPLSRCGSTIPKRYISFY